VAKGKVDVPKATRSHIKVYADSQSAVGRTKKLELEKFSHFIFYGFTEENEYSYAFYPKWIYFIFLRPKIV
jgi:hypothetical protein